MEPGNVCTNDDASVPVRGEGDGSVQLAAAQNGNAKRDDYLSWDEYFMAIAFLSAQRSKDPRTQVGACIVNAENKIVGIGYNGMPIGCGDDIMPWGRNSDDILETKKLYVCHAELNAVLNKNSADVKNCRIYVALFPCNECAKVVIQSGIKEVIYYSDKYAHKKEFVASRRLLDTAGIKCRLYQPPRRLIIIDFCAIEDYSQSVTTNPSENSQESSLSEDLNGVSISLESSLPEDLNRVSISATANT